MILRNLTGRFCKMAISEAFASPTFIDTQGTATTYIYGVKFSYNLTSNGNSGNNSSSTYNGSMNSLQLGLGSGTTNPTFTDYSIESPLDMTTLTLTNSSYSASNSKVTLTTTMQNTSDSDFTFSEALLLAYNGGCKVALTRDVFSPVTIPAGGSKTIAIVIDFAAMATSVA